MNEALQALAGALIMIFCTPFGWVGLSIVGIIIVEIINAKKENNKESK